MDGDAPRPLNRGAATTLLGALLGAAWWALFAMLVWVCFLREAPRGLALTAAWFATPRPLLVAAVSVLVLVGGTLAFRPGPGRHLGLTSMIAGLLTALSWCITLLAP